MTPDPIVENARLTAEDILGLIAGNRPSKVRDRTLAAIILKCRADAIAKGKRAELIDRYLEEVVRQVNARLAIIDATGSGRA